MAGVDRIVYQFPISHYCEKTRWNLDAKGISYSVRDVWPGAHLALARRLGVARGVPILVDGARAIADSTEIALHLERTHRAPALLPTGDDARAKVLELESYFDDRLGPDVRRYIYGALMKWKRGAAAEALFSFYSAPVRLWGRIIGGRIERLLARMYRIDADTVRTSRATVIEALERIELLTKGDPDRYLVGDALTLADVTAASLFAPIVVPPGSPWERFTDLPAELPELRDEVSARAGGEWVLRRYRNDRRRTLS